MTVLAATINWLAVSRHCRLTPALISKDMGTSLSVREVLRLFLCCLIHISGNH